MKLSAKELRIVRYALSLLSCNLDDDTRSAFLLSANEVLNENDVVTLRESFTRYIEHVPHAKTVELVVTDVST